MRLKIINTRIQQKQLMDIIYLIIINIDNYLINGWFNTAVVHKRLDVQIDRVPIVMSTRVCRHEMIIFY